MEKQYHDIAVIAGDLNGKTVTDATLEVVDNIPKSMLSKPIRHTRYDYNADYFLEHDITELRESELEQLAQHDAIFLGAIGDPTKIKPGVLELGILLKLRQEFGQYVNLRPVVLPEGVPSVLVGKDHNDINFEICRENSEGLYVAVGRVENAGTEDEVGIQEMRCSYKAVKRLAEFALERAIAKGEEKGRKPRLHFVFKRNVLTYAASPWTRVGNEFKEEYPDVDTRYMHIDNFGMQMLLDPSQFDVVLTENMFGDIMTDIGAVLQGGIGSAVSGNINPTGEFPSMFEPIHGSAPDKWYAMDENREYIPKTLKRSLIQLVRPEAAFLSYSMMLEHLGETSAGRLLKRAALENVSSLDYNHDSLNSLVKKACWSMESNSV